MIGREPAESETGENEVVAAKATKDVGTEVEEVTPVVEGPEPPTPPGFEAWKTTFDRSIKDRNFPAALTAIKGLSKINDPSGNPIDGKKQESFRQQVLATWSAYLQETWRAEDWRTVRKSAESLLKQWPENVEAKLLLGHGPPCV